MFNFFKNWPIHKRQCSSGYVVIEQIAHSVSQPVPNKEFEVDYPLSSHCARCFPIAFGTMFPASCFPLARVTVEVGRRWKKVKMQRSNQCFNVWLLSSSVISRSSALSSIIFYYFYKFVMVSPINPSIAHLALLTQYSKRNTTMQTGRSRSFKNKYWLIKFICKYWNWSPSCIQFGEIGIAFSFWAWFN